MITREWRCDYGCGTHCRCELPCDKTSFVAIVKKGCYYAPVYLCDLHAKYLKDNPNGEVLSSLLREEEKSPGWVFDGRKIVFVAEAAVSVDKLLESYSWRGSMCGPAVRYVAPSDKPVSSFKPLRDDER